MRKPLIVAVGLCVLTLAMTTADAAKGNKDGKRAKSGDVFAKYDANNNGILDDSEKEAIKKAAATDPALKPYDTNNDGKLSDEEIAGIKPQEKGKKRRNK